MQKKFIYEQIAFDYHLTLERRKTIAIHVHPDQSVKVKAPLHAKDNKIDSFLQRKVRWVLKHQRYFAKFRPRTAKEYISGETFRYLGRNYKLLVRKTTENERGLLHHGILTVFSLCPKSGEHTKELLDDWYAQKARLHFEKRLKICAARFFLEDVPDLTIRRMTSRWGSYSGKTHRICLNLELIKASRRHIDYVLTHELCHITHRSHNKAFYLQLSNHLPDWGKLKNELECSLLSG
ncbi:MAG: M48 family metallopeptidase [Kiritimatiellae bacterium]|nr:M48 family metallopeptidase [Kiritimatiellia bacterium]